SDKFEAQIGFLFKLYKDGRLYNPKVSKLATVHIKQAVAENRDAVVNKDKNPRKPREFNAELILTKSRPKDDEVREMEELITDMRPLNFRTSKQ
ncbi:hypothetical protein LMH81_30050, partial [Vibrio lentus]